MSLCCEAHLYVDLVLFDRLMLEGIIPEFSDRDRMILLTFEIVATALRKFAIPDVFCQSRRRCCDSRALVPVDPRVVVAESKHMISISFV